MNSALQAAASATVTYLKPREDDEEAVLRAHLYDILARRQLSALFQPIVHMPTGEIIAYEGLIRGPSDSPLHAPMNLFKAARANGLTVEVEHLCRKVVLERFAELGLPGKLGFSGAQVWDAYLEGNLIGIRRYCETDVLNTYLVYLRFELLRGRLTRERYGEEVERVKALLRAEKEPHFAEFLRVWEGGA